MRVRSHPAGRPASGLGVVLGSGAGLLVLAGLYLCLLGGPGRPLSAGIGGAFRLVSTAGRTVTDRDFRGRYMLLYFGYTDCRDVCPVTLGAVAQAMRLLGSRAGRVQPVFISVDPARDTPDLVGRFVAGFGPGLIGLTGSATEVRAAERAYRIESVIHPAGHDGAPLVDHTSVLLLVGPDGRFLAPFPADEQPDALAARLQPYLS